MPRRSLQGVEPACNQHRNALSNQTDIKYEYKILATTKKYGVPRFFLTLKDHMPNEPNTYDGIFNVHLNDEGKCTLFEEWYHSTTR